MSLVDFYKGLAPDYKGRMLRDIWTWDHERLEEIHDYIQVLFPLPEPSSFSSRAPILTERETAEFRASEPLQRNLMRSFQLLLDFYGLEYHENPMRVEEASHFRDRALNWLAYGDHNFLRITRILKCLRICGLEGPARAFLAYLLELHKEHSEEIGETTRRYWQDAVK
jgi:hypothetical protein